MDKKTKLILDLCGGTGAWSRPYKYAGYDVKNITLPDFDVTKWDILGNILMFQHQNQGQTLSIDVRYIHGILAAPPCTMFSLARTRAKQPRDFNEGMKTVEACLEIIWEIRKRSKIKFWALENPLGYLRQFLGKPPFTFDPCDFGDPYTKKTDLWGYFNLPIKKPIQLTVEQTNLCAINNRKLPSISDLTGSSQSARRAVTPTGFANSFFKVNQ